VEPAAAERRLLAEITRRSPDVALLVDTAGRITWASRQVEDLLGYPPSEVVGRAVEELVPEERRASHKRQREGFTPTGVGSMGGGRYLEALAADGAYRPVDIRFARFDADHVLVVLRDAAERKALEDGLRLLADSDPLTGLANRRAVLAHIEAALARTRRRGDWMGLCYLDLDRFKPVNDHYGHEAGDQVLRAVSRALLGSVRDGDVVGRVGGDEFVIVLEELGSDRAAAEREVEEVAGRALGALARPVRYAGLVLEPHASAGVAVSSDGDSDDLMRAADAALYVAKAGAAGPVVVAGRVDADPTA
jgi:diguanylate cyclase (GGDEF)-like protein/PAS domain S-box-containing protein